MISKETYMHRCIALAKAGEGYVAPNPLVGSVLVHENRIIGEGCHQLYGQPHAEVNCINAVHREDEHLISKSTIYVSLEPCAHHGKTPPCADLIIRKNIKRVVIGCRDPFKEVDGKGVEKLLAAGVEVEQGILEAACKKLNKRFFTFHTQHRPYIVLKWAQSNDHKIAGANFGRMAISNDFTNRLVHKWRRDEAAIMVGANTAIYDNPTLTTRLWKGPNPVRLLLDMNLRVPASHHLLDGSVQTIVFNKHQHREGGNLQYYQLTEDVNMVHQLSNALYQMNIQSVLVEGGARLLQSFIDEGCWDEAVIITNEQLIINNGIQAPTLTSATKQHSTQLLNDKIEYFTNSRFL